MSIPNTIAALRAEIADQWNQLDRAMENEERSAARDSYDDAAFWNADAAISRNLIQLYEARIARICSERAARRVAIVRAGRVA